MTHGTLEGWIAYAAQRGLTVASEEASSQALVRAQDHIRFVYIENFASEDDAPEAVLEAATYEAAAIELATPRIFSGRYNPSQQKVLTQADTMKWTPIGNSTDAMPRSTLVEKMLGGYVVDTTGLTPFGLFSVGR